VASSIHTRLRTYHPSDRKKTNLSIKLHIRFEVFTALTMKNVVCWDVTPWTSQKTPFFIVTAVKTSNLTKLHVRFQIFTALTMKNAGMWRRVSLVRTDVSEAIRFSKTSVLTRVARRHNQENDNLQSPCCYFTLYVKSVISMCELLFSEDLLPLTASRLQAEVAGLTPPHHTRTS
jgi:hypothetical protein